MARAWQPPLYRPSKFSRVLHSRRFIIGGLALAAVPAAAGAFNYRSNSFQTAHTTISSQASDITEENNSGTISPLSVSSSLSQDGNTSPSIKVTVNGQEIPVPENGRVDQTIPSDDGNTDVHVDSGDASDQSGTSLNVNIDSSSSSTGNSRERSSTTLRIRSTSK